MTTPDLVGIVIAAGGSARMGRPKALLPLGDTCLLQAHIDAMAGFVSEVVVVVGSRQEEVVAALRPGSARIRHNPDWATTDPADSVRRAAQALGDGQEALVTPVDVPPPSPGLLGALTARTGALVPRGPAGDGHPVRLGATELRVLRRGDRLERGLRTLLRDAPRHDVPFDVAVDFDTPDAWNRFLRTRVTAE